MIVEAAPYRGVDTPFFDKGTNHGLQGALLVRGDVAGRRGRSLPFRSSIHPVVPKSVVTLGLIKFDLGSKFGANMCVNISRHRARKKPLTNGMATVAGGVFGLRIGRTT